MKGPVETLNVVFYRIFIIVFLVEVLGDDGKEDVDVGYNFFSLSLRFAFLILVWVKFI